MNFVRELFLGWFEDTQAASTDHVRCSACGDCRNCHCTGKEPPATTIDAKPLEGFDAYVAARPWALEARCYEV